MSDITEKVLDTRIAAVKKWVLFTAEDVSTDDTLTIGDLTSIDSAAVFNRADGATVTQTDATNVITIGGSYTNIDVVGLAIGS